MKTTCFLISQKFFWWATGNRFGEPLLTNGEETIHSSPKWLDVDTRRVPQIVPPCIAVVDRVHVQLRRAMRICGAVCCLWCCETVSSPPSLCDGWLPAMGIAAVAVA